MKKTWILKFLNFWPPYLGAGVRVKRIAPDFSVIEVEMRLRFWNTNYVGTHFGGSLYSMVDPFFMLMLIERLGRGYTVWDKAASIRFRRPGKGKVTARFEIGDAQLSEIRARADELPKFEPTFRVEIRDGDGQVIAEVEKLLYVKRRDAPAPTTPRSSSAT